MGYKCIKPPEARDKLRVSLIKAHNAKAFLLWWNSLEWTCGRGSAATYAAVRA